MNTLVDLRSSPNVKAAYNPMRLRVICRLPTMLVAFAGLIFCTCHTSTPQPPGTPTATIAQPTTPTPTPTPTTTPIPAGITYYVDSSLGSDENNCALAQNPSTPKRTVNGVMSCDPGPGETIRFRGEFTETIFPRRSGTVLYDVQDVAGVDEAVITFNQAIANANPSTDYVTIYGSRKGNSGAFAIISVSGNRVTVDTSDLPAGQFITEAVSDPGALQAAILRPVHFTAWDENNPPVWSGLYQVYQAINQRVIMVSHLKSIGGNSVNPGYYVWPAFEIDGSDHGNSDFQIFDHLEVTNAESAIAIEAHEFQSNYDILQFNNLHDVGYPGDVSDEIIYFGFAYRPDLHHDFVQIMYNRIGPHNRDSTSGDSIAGDGIEIKPSAHNATLFGNEINGIAPAGCDDAPIKTAGLDTFIANNYLHNVNPRNFRGCGISIVKGADGALVVNNIVANVKEVGIRVLDTNNVQILNNTIYNILPEPNCDPACMENNMGIEIWNYLGSTENIVIKNNIIQTAYIGIGRYIWSNDFLASIDSDYNLVFNSDFPFRGTIGQNAHDLVIEPYFIDPQNNNFALMDTSPARDSGIDLTSIFSIDNHNAANPRLPAITAPIIRTDVWDRGAYEYK